MKATFPFYRPTVSPVGHLECVWLTTIHGDESGPGHGLPLAAKLLTGMLALSSNRCSKAIFAGQVE
jgi:hypothetical protein